MEIRGKESCYAELSKIQKEAGLSLSGTGMAR